MTAAQIKAEKLAVTADRTERRIKAAMPAVVTFIGIILIISGICQILVHLDYFSNLKIFILSPIAYILAGIVIVSNPRRSIVKTVALYCIGLALSRLFDATGTFMHNDIFGIGLSSSLFYIYGLIKLGLSVSCFYSGFNFYRGTSLSTWGMKTGGLFFSVLYLLILYKLMLNGNDIGDVLGSSPELFIYLFQFIILLCLLESKELRDSVHVNRTVEKLDRMRATYSLDSEQGISPMEADVLSKMFIDRSEWRHFEDDGPVEDEYGFQLGEGACRTCIIVQKWKNHKDMFFTAVDSLDSNILLADRFTVSASEQKEIDGKRYLCLYHPDGSMTALEVRTDFDRTVPKGISEVLERHC